jgi:predicted peptidase
MKYPITACLFLMCAMAAAQDLGVYEKRQYIGSKGDTLPYRILFPEQYDRTRKYPLILFLHGAGERGNDNEKQLTHGASLFMQEKNRSSFPAIVIFPQCPLNSYWASVKVDRTKTPYGLDFDYSRPPTAPLACAIELVKKIAKEERVKASQLYIMGLSMGGMGTFEAVYRNPKLFAAAMPVCGGGDTLRYDKRVRKVPFWVFHGDKDAVVDVQHSRRMVARLEDLKASVKYTEYPGINHNSWDYAFAEPGFLPWLFSHKR